MEDKLERRQSKDLWPARLSFDLAMGESDDSICEIYGLGAYELKRIKENGAFRREVAEHKREIQEHGVTFRAKARLQAEEYLLNIDDLVQSPDVPASVKLEAIKSVVRWGGLDPGPSNKPEGGPMISNKIEVSWVMPSNETAKPYTIDVPRKGN